MRTPLSAASPDRSSRFKNAVTVMRDFLAPAPFPKYTGPIQFLIWALLHVRLPVLLPCNIIEPGEGGVLDRKHERWIDYHDVGRVDYDAPRIELLDRAGKRLVAWSETNDPLAILRELEVGVHAVRSASDMMQLGRGELNTREWLAALGRRFFGEQGYRCQVLNRAGLRAALEDKAGRADVRAGAAFALLATDPVGNSSLVSSTLTDCSPPLLIAVCSVLSPGTVKSESLANARRYLTVEERAAIEGFGRPAARGCRISLDQVPEQLEEPPAMANHRTTSRW